MSSTIYDVAKLASVSTATVSRVINRMGNVKPSTEKRVKSAMEALHFTPNSLAQSFSSNKSFTIGFVMSLSGEHRVFNQDQSFISYYYTELFRGINSILETKGYSLLVLNNNNSEDDLSRMFDQKKIDGLIIGHLPKNTSSFRSLINKKVPMAYIGHIFQYNRGLHVYAQYNNYLNTVLSYFKEKKHKRILFLCLRDREELIMEWEDLNFYFHKELEIEFVKAVDDKNIVRDIITEHFSKEDAPTAIFSENLSDIQPIISSLNALQLSVPENVSLISVEHIKDAGHNYVPKLTNVYVPVFEMGKAAIKLLLEYMEDSLEIYDTQIVLESNLIERDSVNELVTVS
jgi:LacI family transcriptional regulator